MIDLSKMPMPQLALALTGEPRLPMDEVLAECRRRQRILDAQGAMLDALNAVENHLKTTYPPYPPNESPYERVRRAIAIYNHAAQEPSREGQAVEPFEE